MNATQILLAAFSGGGLSMVIVALIVWVSKRGTTHAEAAGRLTDTSLLLVEALKKNMDEMEARQEKMSVKMDEMEKRLDRQNGHIRTYRKLIHDLITFIDRHLPDHPDRPEIPDCVQDRN